MIHRDISAKDSRSLLSDSLKQNKNICIAHDFPWRTGGWAIMGWGKSRQTACKPGSVPVVSHDGRPFIWDVRCRTPHATDPGGYAEVRFGPALRRDAAAPIWSCSRWGLPCRFRCRSRGALLPHPFTLTVRAVAGRDGGLLSVALSLGSPPPDVIRHRTSVEPGLSSPRGKPGKRPSSRLARAQCGGSGRSRQGVVGCGGRKGPGQVEERSITCPGLSRPSGMDPMI